MQTLFGTWTKPSLFTTEDGIEMRVYSYSIIIESVTFPLICFIQLEGNVIKNYIPLSEG